MWDDEASELAHSRSSWRQRVAQCVFDTDELRSQQTGRQKHKRQSQVTDWQLLGPDGSASERVPQIQHLIVADGQELILTGVNRQTPHLVMVALHTHTHTHAHTHANKKMPENNFCLMMLVWQLQRQTKVCHQHLCQLSSK